MHNVTTPLENGEKRGNVREFNSCEGNMQEIDKKSGKCWGGGNLVDKTVYCQVHIVATPVISSIMHVYYTVKYDVGNCNSVGVL